MSPLPAYVEYGGRATAPPPFLSTEGTFRGLLLEGDAGLIAALIDRVLNEPAAGRVIYRPMFGKWVLMQTGAFKKVSSQAQGFEQWGYVDEAQISLWIPVVAGTMQGGDFVLERIGMCVPYILVNNPMSYAGGREIYGYPKTSGIFKPKTAVGDPQLVEAFGGNFSPESAAGWHPLFELSRTGGQHPGAGSQGADEQRPTFTPEEGAQERLGAVWPGLAADLPSWSLLQDIWNLITGKQMRQVFLKQFRDVETAGVACYQEIVEAPIEYLKSKMTPAIHEWKVVVHHLDSHPVDTELGVGTQTTWFTFDVEMDFIAAKGVVVT